MKAEIQQKEKKWLEFEAFSLLKNKKEETVFKEGKKKSGGNTNFGSILYQKWIQRTFSMWFPPVSA